MAKLPPGLSDKVRELMAPHVAPDTGMLEAIGNALSGKRDEAVAARKESGVELIWYEAERAYAGIDDANMGQFAGSRWQKSMSIDGPLTERSGRQDQLKSNVYVPLTPRYTDAGAAKMGEILVPIDGKAFGIEATPVPSMTDLKDDNTQVVSPTLGVPLTRPAKPEEIAAGQQAAPAPLPVGAPQAAVPAPAGPSLPAGAAGPLPPAAGPLPPGAAPPPAEPPEVPLTHADLAKEQIAAASKKAKKAEDRMSDWLAECQYGDETRKVIFDSARLGVGVLKGPFPTSTTTRAISTTEQGIEIVTEEAVAPAAKWIDAWNAFPDPHCGENVSSGSFFFERDMLTEADVEKLKKQPGYISSQIEKVLQEGPNKAYTLEEDDRPGALKKTEGRYEIWYFTGSLKRDELDCICQAAGKPLRNGEARGEAPSSLVTMINDTVVRATPNPLQSGSLGYHSMPWQRRVGSWAGKGIPEQMQTAQKIVNAGMRRLLDNAGLAAGSQIVMDPMAVEPADGVRAMTPNKFWNKTSDGAGRRIDEIFSVFNIPIFTDDLLKIYQTGLQMAEESTSIPLVTQGQSGPTTPNTFGATQLQNNNANQLLRSLGYIYDGNITVPFIKDLYEWLLLDPNVPADEKGDFKVVAKGSAVLVERAIADQSMASVLSLAANPVYGINPRNAFSEWAKSQRLDPSNFQNTPEEQEKLDMAAQQQPAAPQIEVAKIRQQTDQARIELDKAENAAEREHREKALKTQAMIDLNEMEDRKESELQRRETDLKRTLEQVKALLAKTAMTLEVQERLSRQNNANNNGNGGNNGRGNGGKRIRPQRGGTSPQVAPAAAEPAGRAPDGRGFTQ